MQLKFGNILFVMVSLEVIQYGHLMSAYFFPSFNV